VTAPPPSASDNGSAENGEEESPWRRRIAVASLGLAAAIVIYLLLFGRHQYEVTAEFENAAQLVRGSQVVVGGAPVGSVKDIQLGDHGQALVTFSVGSDYAPLHRGTTATIRSYSLSGIANRQVQLTLPASNQAGPSIPSGGDLSTQETVSEVDLDQLFNTLNPKTIRNFKHVIQGFEVSYEGVGKQANTGFRYLNPFLSTSRRVFSELTLDQNAFSRLIVDTSHLSGALAQRAPDISGLIHNTNLMMGALGSQRIALADAVSKLPGFMREANTTFVNLRATLDDLDPLVDASKPVADRLGPFFREFRAAASDAVPTISDLDQIIKRPGKNNDLIDLTNAQVPLQKVAIGSSQQKCASDPTSYAQLQAIADSDPPDDFKQGAFSESVCSLLDSIPQLAFFRAYTPELVGWFNDFGTTSGIADANGGMGRIATSLNMFSLTSSGVPNILGAPQGFQQAIDALGPPQGGDYTGNRQRCPGALERDPGDGSTPYTDHGTIPCVKTEVPVGP
jgi:phospholipid/cholesterol/gamma-HCH transport system substrate-binding protein